MTIVVEDGTGLANAQSYVSIAEADAYLTARGKFDAWDEFDADEKGAFLVRGADYLTQTYRMGWSGYRRTTDQALDWPRYDVPKQDAPNGAYYAYYNSDVVPAEVKSAQIEAAFRLATVGDLLPDVSAPVIERTIGPITTRYAVGAKQTPTFPVIDRLLAPLLKGSSGSASVVRS